MARYFYGNSELQGGNGGGDGLQTLVLMNPGYVGFSENPSQPPANFVFLNPNSSENGGNIPHAPSSSQRQHLVGVPLQGSSEAQHQDGSSFHGYLQRGNYNVYEQNGDMSVARESTRAQQGLSLSLSSQQPPPGYGAFVQERDVVPSQNVVSSPRGVGSPSSGSGMTSGVMLSSKYLKAAQELLDEVVSVGKGSSVNDSGLNVNGNKKSGESTMSGTDQDGKSGAEGSSSKHVDELTTAEKQEIQMKKAKLVNMLDEVEQRYRQYHHQMQIVISWFEQASRVGSAKTYTALALETISKQFRCLKDAILGQIRAASKNLGEEDALVAGKGEGSRLKYVDNQIRQQRALQQLGMIQHNAWRPQRGLPERSVTVLRAWLFEHFLHPYPKDSDKVILAKQTGLTRSQVSNWFINARVRLWKPMVEEMYMEEMKGLETTNAAEDKDNNNSPISTQDSISKSTAPQPKSPLSENHNNKTFISKQDHNSMPQNASPMQGRFNLIENISQSSPKKSRNNADMSHTHPSMNMESNPDNDHMSMKFTLMGTPTNFIGGFGSYPIGELGRYETDQFQAPYSGNGVSLTLGLPHCENLSMGGNHPNFLPSQGMQLGRAGVELGESDGFNGMNTPTSSHSTNVYESINIQNRNKRFASELLPDFVA